MSETVERVKRAIGEKLAPAIDLRAPYAKIMVAEAARAAIEALREPTEAVINALIASLGADNDRSTAEKALDAWLAANAAMLAENAALVSERGAEE